MGDAKSLLRQWALDFIRSRDAFFRKIAKIDDSSNNFIVSYKDGRQQPHLILPNLADASQVLSSLAQDQHVAIVSLNNKANREKLAESWKTLAQYKLLTIYFANPFSQGEKKWVLMPHVHDKICDAASLTTGFNSLSELVEDISEEDAARKA